MILGVGTDLIEIDRIKDAINNTPMFLEKIFTNNEIQYLTKGKLRIETIAGNFAVKEISVRIFHSLLWSTQSKTLA